MKPIRIMIVDDEILAIRHLENLVCWEELGFTVAAKAFTANMALEMADAVKPQVIFMDIRMPAMNGLELSRRILANNSSVKIILLTSYKDFEYAKSALEIGISGYMLKHDTNADNLTEQLIKLKRELEAEAERERFVFRQHLKGVVEGGELPGHVLETVERSARESGTRFLLFYLHADVPFPVLDIGDYSISGALPNADEWGEICGNGESRGLQWIESVVLNSGKQLVLYSAAAYSGERQLLSDSYSTASMLQSEAAKRGRSVSILISQAFTKMEALPKLYRELDKKSSLFILYGKQTIKYAQELKLPDSGLLEEWRSKAQHIRNLPNQHDERELARCLKAVFAEMKTDRFHPEGLKLICNEFIRIMERQMQSKGMPSYGDLVRKHGAAQSGRWHSLEDIKQWFIDEIGRITEYSSQAASYSKKVQQAVRYIHEHYKEELTAETIGEALSVSGDHLRHLFKAEVGRTVSDYLTGCRVEKAKELLMTGQYKIYEISELVGYKTSQYFSQVFKRWTGLTPQEFTESTVKGK
ncbi:response regulator transcription factor [Paenibacillus alkalitolerans]|uniref:response regulator transcription factor n=1 Tax=Paenibacillus alkalitolerans TaxID=2799335 RepID=UPI0018F3E513|nr:response regulator [Paenibacillus alkalitolerans]